MPSLILRQYALYCRIFFILFAYRIFHLFIFCIYKLLPLHYLLLPAPFHRFYHLFRLQPLLLNLLNNHQFFSLIQGFWYFLYLTLILYKPPNLNLSRLKPSISFPYLKVLIFFFPFNQARS